MVDPTQALQWYKTLFDGEEGLCPTEFRCIHPRLNGPRKIVHHWGAFESIEDCQALAELNKRGYGIFAVINKPSPHVAERVQDHRGTRDEDIERITAVFVEIDKEESDPGANLRELLNAPLPPTLIVRSSLPNRLHAYWRVADLPLEEFRAFQIQLIQRFGAGVESKNPARVLRVPGFLHTKGTPIRSELLVTDEVIYTRAELIEAFEIDPHLTPEREPYAVPEEYAPPPEIADRILQAARRQARNLGSSGRHGKLFWSALSCLDNRLPIEEARRVTRQTADLLPPRDNGKPVPHKEADDVTNWVYKNCVPGKPWNEGAHWEARKPLPPLLPEAPTLPSNLLPGPLRPFVDDAAERICVHREFIAVPLICALGAIIGRTVGLHPKQHDDWLEPANIWGALVGNPSARKTPALKEATAPLRVMAGKAREQYEYELQAWQVEQEVIKLEIDQLKRKARGAKGDPRTIQAELQEKLQALEANEAVEKRYFTNDSTTEKLGELLKTNPRGLLVLNDELTRWLTSFEKPGREGDRAFYLESWNGTGSFSIDRIGRGSLHIPALTLSICGTIQPGALASYIHGAIDGGGQADGLLQRIQLLVFPDKPLPFRLVDRKPDAEARRAVQRIFEFLDDLDPLRVGAAANPNNPDSIPTLRFAKDAQEVFNGWLEQFMNRVQAPELGPFPAFQAHLGKYPTLVTRLSLIFHLVGIASGKRPGPVDVHTLELALGWAEFLEEHARKIYAAELHHELVSAHALAERIEKGHVTDGQPLRDIYRAGWSSLKTPEQVGAAIRVLQDLGWVRTETHQPGQQGGRPSEVLRLHPEVCK